MYANSKDIIKCPKCSSHAHIINKSHYECEQCDWNSLKNTVDISYSDPLSAPLSNLFPHPFIISHDPIINLKHGKIVSLYSLACPTSSIRCSSMESFIQSLRVSDPVLQKQICENYSGYMAYKLRLSLNDWRADGIVYWQGQTIRRNSKEYTTLITEAYDCLFRTNDVFSKLVLPRFKDKVLIHSIGCDYKTQTLLTEEEYRFQLNRLMQKLS